MLVLALVARFRYLTQIEHNIDHAYPIWQAMRTLSDGIFPLAGQGTSVLFANPPVTGYLYLPVVAIFPAPIAVYVLVIALNTLGVWLTYRAVGGLFRNATLGVIAAGLMAINPWVIEYSRTSWVQALLPFFIPAIAWMLWPVLLGRARQPGRRVIGAGVLLAVGAHTYLLAFFIVAPVLMLVVIFWRRMPRRAVLTAGLIFAFPLTLYGVGLLGQLDDVNQRIETFGEADSRLTTEAWSSAVRLVTGADYELARGTLAPADDMSTRHDLTRIVHFGLLGLILIGIGGALYALIRRTTHRDAAVIVLIWFFVPVAAMSYTGNPVHPFYQLLTLPGGYALATWGLMHLIQPHRYRVGAVAVGLLFVPVAALSLTNSARYYQETATIPGVHGLRALPVDYGHHLGTVIDATLSPTGRVYAPAETWILNSFSGDLFPAWLDTRAPNFHYLPAEGGLYIQISTQDAPQPLGSVRVEQIPLPDGTVIVIDQLPPAGEATLPGTVIDTPTQEGLTLHRYDLQRDDLTWTLTTIWRVDAPPDAVDTLILGPFAHIHDAEGERIINAGGEGLPGYEWRVGDLHVHRMTFTLPPDAQGPFTLRVGQYDGLNNIGLTFTPTGSDPEGAVTLPLGD